MSISSLQSEIQRSFVILPEARPLLAAVKRVAQVMMCFDVVELLSLEQTGGEFLFTLQELAGSHKMLTLLVSYYSDFGQFMFRGDVTQPLGRQCQKLIEALSCVLSQKGKASTPVIEQGPLQVTDVIANGQVLRLKSEVKMEMSEVQPTQLKDSVPLVRHFLASSLPDEEAVMYGDDLILSSQANPIDDELKTCHDEDDDEMPDLVDIRVDSSKPCQGSSVLRHPSFSEMASLYADTLISEVCYQRYPGKVPMPMSLRFNIFFDLHSRADSGEEVEMLSMPDLLEKEDISYTEMMVARQSPFVQTLVFQGSQARVISLEQLCIMATYQGYHRRLYTCLKGGKFCYMLVISPFPLSMHFEGLTVNEVMQMLANEKQPFLLWQTDRSKRAVVSTIHDFTLLSAFHCEIEESGRVSLYHDAASIATSLVIDPIISSVIGWANGHKWPDYEDISIFPGVNSGVRLSQEQFMALDQFKTLNNGQKHQYLCYFHIVKSSYQQFRSVTFLDDLIRSHRSWPRDISLIAEEVLQEITKLKAIQVGSVSFGHYQTEEELGLLVNPLFQQLTLEERQLALIRFRTVVAAIEGCWHVLESMQRNDASDQEEFYGRASDEYECDSDRGQSDYENHDYDSEGPVREEIEPDVEHWW